MNSSVEPGRYRIQLAAGPKPYIGVDPSGDSIITGGSDNIWTIKPKNVPLGGGAFALHLREDKQHLHVHIDVHGQLVVNEKPTWDAWIFLPQPDGTYTIQVYIPATIPLVQVWAVEDPSEPKSSVVLQEIDQDDPTESQRWYFHSLDL